MKNARVLSSIPAFICLVAIILDGKTALLGAVKGIELCLKSVIPALFPFFFLSGIIIDSLWGTNLPVLRRLGKAFYLPAGTESILIPAFLGGYPSGANTIGQLYKNKLLAKKDAEKMLSYCNNAGPSFVFGILAPILPSVWFAWIIWAILIIGAWITCQLFHPSAIITITFPKQRATIAESMNHAVCSIANVCGWIIFFRVIISFTEKWFLWMLPKDIQILFVGFLELSNGCFLLASVADMKYRLLFAIILLSAGGLCVTLQTASSVNDLSLKFYILGKVVQCSISVLLTILLLSQNRLPLFFVFLALVVIIAKWQNKSSILQETGV